jgi:hypothetical protein
LTSIFDPKVATLSAYFERVSLSRDEFKPHDREIDQLI